jgi:hypothetical protein
LKESIPSFLIPQSSPQAAFEKFGLRPRGAGRGAWSDAAYAGLSPSARFRNALEELGGLYAAFGLFLCWRADLLRPDFLGRLRQLQAAPPPIETAEFARILSGELGEAGMTLAQNLEARPCWNTLARCAYRTQYQGRGIVAQVARDPIPDSAFQEFEAGVGLLEEEDLKLAVKPETLASFREWMRLTDSPDRERSYLEALASAREKTMTQYPVMIPAISSGRVLCLEWVEGASVASLIAAGSAQAAECIAECVLEQICTIAAVDGDFDPESMVVTQAGKLVLRRANRLVAIPPFQTRHALKYVSGVLASNGAAAAHMLVKMASSRQGLSLENRLRDELSNLEPELKINLQFPPSAAIFEDNWRALTRIGAEKPLFLDILHRNLVAAGYWNAETAPAALPMRDFLAEAQWPVLGRMLRTRLAELATREAASDWFIGSGLLFFESLRQLNHLAEGLRENDLSLGVDLQREDDPSKVHERIRSGILIGMLLVVFLACLRFAVSAEGAWSVVLSACAGVAGFALFWFVSRFD